VNQKRELLGITRIMDEGEARQGFGGLQEQIAVFRRKALFRKRNVVPGINT
jgi:hypothetical protein